MSERSGLVRGNHGGDPAIGAPSTPFQLSRSKLWPRITIFHRFRSWNTRFSAFGYYLWMAPAAYFELFFRL